MSHPERQIEEIRSVQLALVRELLAKGSAMPALPTIAASRVTFTAFRRARTRLLSTGSGGAIEQYLLAGLMQQELMQSGSTSRISTKQVGANDAAARTGGDIEVRRAQALTGAVEVTGAEWEPKLHQVEAAATAGLGEVTIAAAGVAGLDSDELAQAVAPVAERLGLDISVVDLHAMMDTIASRLTPYGRSDALAYVYRCITRWHRARPELALRVIRVLADLDLLVEDSASGPGVELVWREDDELAVIVDRIRGALPEDIASDSLTPHALRAVAAGLEAAVVPDDRPSSS